MRQLIPAPAPKAPHSVPQSARTRAVLQMEAADGFMTCLQQVPLDVPEEEDEGLYHRAARAYWGVRRLREWRTCKLAAAYREGCRELDRLYWASDIIRIPPEWVPVDAREPRGPAPHRE